VADSFDSNGAVLGGAGYTDPNNKNDRNENGRDHDAVPESLVGFGWIHRRL